MHTEIRASTEYIHYAQETIEEKEKLLKEAKELKEIGRKEIESEYKSAIMENNYQTKMQKERLIKQVLVLSVFFLLH